MNSNETYRCWAEIDRSALLHNLGVVRERIGTAEVLAVVKANAYGLGLIGVSETIASEVQLFGVANLEEAIALRTAGLPHPVIILGPALPAERSTIAERKWKRNSAHTSATMMNSSISFCVRFSIERSINVERS